MIGAKITRNGDIYVPRFEEGFSSLLDEGVVGEFHTTLDLLNVNSKERIAPLSGHVATLLPEGGVAVTEGTENLFNIDNVRKNYNYVSTEIISDYHVIAYYDNPSGGAGNWAWSSGWFHIIHNAPFSQGDYSFSFDAKILEQGNYSTVLKLRLQNGNDVTLKDLGTIELSQEFKHFIVQFNVDVENADALQIALNSNSVEFKNIQLEAKPFATPFVDGTRPAGALSYPSLLVAGKTEIAILMKLTKPELLQPTGSHHLLALFSDVSAPYPDTFVLFAENGVNELRFRTRDSEGLSQNDVIITNCWDDKEHMVVAYMNHSPASGRHKKELYFDGELVGYSDPSGMPDLSKAVDTRLGHWNGTAFWGSPISLFSIIDTCTPEFIYNISKSKARLSPKGFFIPGGMEEKHTITFDKAGYFASFSNDLLIRNKIHPTDSIKPNGLNGATKTDYGLIYNTDGSLCATLLPEGGVAVTEGTTNLWTNPGWLDGTLSGWDAYSTDGATGERQVVPDGRFGYALRLTKVDSGAGRWGVRQGKTWHSTGSVIADSVYVKVLSAQTGAKLRLYSDYKDINGNARYGRGFELDLTTMTIQAGSNGARHLTLTPVGDGWYRVEFVTNDNDIVSGTSYYWIDGAPAEVLLAYPQKEAKPFATSFVDGTRPAGALSYNLPISINGDWTIAKWLELEPYFMDKSRSGDKPIGKSRLPLLELGRTYYTEGHRTLGIYGAWADSQPGKTIRIIANKDQVVTYSSDTITLTEAEYNNKILAVLTKSGSMLTAYIYTVGNKYVLTCNIASLGDISQITPRLNYHTVTASSRMYSKRHLNTLVCPCAVSPETVEAWHNNPVKIGATLKTKGELKEFCPYVLNKGYFAPLNHGLAFIDLATENKFIKPLGME